MKVITNKEIHSIGSDWSTLLIKGDCLEAMNELADIGIKIDLILTDPPYGTTRCKWDSVIPFELMWKCIKNLRHSNTPIVLFGSEPFSSALRMSNIKEFKYDWVWDKMSPTGHLNARKRPMKKFEMLSVFYLTQPKYLPPNLLYNPRITRRKSYTCYGSCGESNISEYKGYPSERLIYKKERGMHETQKPVALLEYLIKTYTNEGDAVLDFTMGSGSTAIACLNTKRKFIGIEKDDYYFQTTKERVEKNYELLNSQQNK